VNFVFGSCLSQLQWQVGEDGGGAATMPAGRVSMQGATKWAVSEHFKLKKLILCAQHTVDH